MLYFSKMNVLNVFLFYAHGYFFFSYMCVCVPHVCSAHRSQRGCQMPWNWSYRYIYGWELLGGCCKLNLGPLEKQSGLLTSEPSLQSYIF